MLNLRYIFRLVGAFLTRFKALIIICMGIGIALFFILKYFLPYLTGLNIQRIGMTGRYTASSLPPSILSMISDGLTKIDTNGYVVPGLATSWETPDRGKTWVFKLKDGVTWQDGKKVTSSGIVYQFSDVTVERPNDKTITFKLQNPYAAFPVVVSRPVFKSGLLGTGKYKVTDISLNGSIVESFSLAGDAGDKIVYKFYPTEERTKLAFELGKVDKITDIFNPEPFTAWRRAKISHTVKKGEYVAVFFNTQDKNLSEKNLRQALSYAINKNVPADERAISPISIDSWAYNPQVKPYNYDPAKARSMVGEYKDAVKETELNIKLATTPVLLKRAEAIAKDWEAAGVKVELQVVSALPSDYQAFLAIFDFPEDPDQYSIWHSTQKNTNLTHYENPRIDKLLEDGRSEVNTETRKKIYFDFQRFLVEDSPAAFLYYPTVYSISRY